MVSAEVVDNLHTIVAIRQVTSIHCLTSNVFWHGSVTNSTGELRALMPHLAVRSSIVQNRRKITSFNTIFWLNPRTRRLFFLAAQSARSIAPVSRRNLYRSRHDPGILRRSRAFLIYCPPWTLARGGVLTLAKKFVRPRLIYTFVLFVVVHLSIVY